MTTTSSDTPHWLRRPANGDGPNLRTAWTGNWGLIALRGILAVLFGLAAVILPGAAMLALVLYFAAYMFADGVVTLIAAVRAGRRGGRWGLLLLLALSSLAAGAIAVLWPGLTVLTFVIIIAAVSVVTGIVQVRAAFQMGPGRGRWWLGFGGIISALFGVVLAVAPLLGAVVLTWWVGIYAIIFGVASIVLAFRLRARRDVTA